MKFYGFLRLLKEPPNIVVPLWTDESRIYQSIYDNNNIITSFSEIKKLDKSRIITTLEKNIDEIDIGDKNLFAYEYSKKSIAVGDLDGLKNRISKIAKNVSFSDKPFSWLELSIFVNDRDSILKAAERCLEIMQKNSPQLREKWLSGSNLPENVIDKINIENDRNVFDKKVRISIPRVLISLIGQNILRNGKLYLAENLEAFLESGRGDEVYSIIDFYFEHLQRIYEFSDLDYILFRKSSSGEFEYSASGDEKYYNISALEGLMKEKRFYISRPYLYVSKRGREFLISADIYGRNTNRYLGKERMYATCLIYSFSMMEPEKWKQIVRNIGETASRIDESLSQSQFVFS